MVLSSYSEVLGTKLRSLGSAAIKQIDFPPPKANIEKTKGSSYSESNANLINTQSALHFCHKYREDWQQLAQSANLELRSKAKSTSLVGATVCSQEQYGRLFTGHPLSPSEGL